MSREEDPKFQARQELKRRDVQQDLRQFLKLESGLGNSNAFRRNWDLRHTPDIPLNPPVRCCSTDCAYIAETRKEAMWHVEQCPGHAFLLPGKDK